MIDKRLQRSIRNNNWEATDDGQILLPKDNVFIGGVFRVKLNGELIEESPNLVVNEGLNHFLNVVLGATSKIASWYLALFKGNVTPAGTWTCATFDSLATELTEYSETTHPAFVNGTSTAQSIDNAGNEGVFTINGTVTCYGAALMSQSTKPTPASGGTLIAASRFASARSLVASDELNVGYGVSMTSS